jgi:hypothetical protein
MCNFDLPRKNLSLWRWLGVRFSRVSDLLAETTARVRVWIGDRHIVCTESISGQTHPKFQSPMKVPLTSATTLTFQVNNEVQKRPAIATNVLRFDLPNPKELVTAIGWGWFGAALW